MSIRLFRSSRLAAAVLVGAACAAGAQSTLPLHGTPLLHSFTDSANVYPESVTVDQATGTIYVGSVKEGTIYRGKIGSPQMEVFSPAGADGRTMATGMFYANNRLVVLGRQSGLLFVYDTTTGRLVSKLDNGLREGKTFLNDVTFAPDGSAYATDSINPVLYRIAPTASGGYALQEFLRFHGTPVKYVQAPGAPGINVNGIVATPDGRYLVIAKRNENALYRIDLATREVVPVVLPRGALDTPDGMFIEGDRLYVAQNMPKAVAILRLSDAYTRATPEGVVRNPAFDFPTSVALYRDKMLVVSAQFDTLGSPAAVSGTQPPVLPFWVTELTLALPGQRQATR